jgi:hypothetical protein
MICLLNLTNKKTPIFCSLLSILVAFFILSTPVAHADVPAPNAAGYLVQGSRGEFKEATVAIHIPQLNTDGSVHPTITMSLTLGGVGQGLTAVATQIVSSVDNNGHQTNVAQWSETVDNGTPKTGSLDGSITINPNDTVWLYVGSDAHLDGAGNQGYNGFQVKDGTQTATHYESGPFSDSGGVSATLQASSPLRSDYPVAGFNYVVFVGFDVADTPPGVTSPTWKPIGQLTTVPQSLQQTPSGGGSPIIVTDALRKGPTNTDSDFDVTSE